MHNQLDAKITAY